MLTKESLAKSLAEKEAELKERQEALFRSDWARGEVIGEINRLSGAIDTLRWMLEEQDEKA